MKTQSYARQGRSEEETRVLGRIIDAMLAVQTDLQNASVEQWSKTLLDACRRQKRLASVSRMRAA
jgi:hypothetical protein